MRRRIDRSTHRSSGDCSFGLRVSGASAVTGALTLLAVACGGDGGPTDPGTSVTVQGTVTERGTGAGIDEVTVSGTRPGTDDQLFQTTTDASGDYEASFEVTDEPDEIVVETEKEKYVAETASVAFSQSATVDLELEWGSPFDEDCLPVDPDNVEVQQDGSDWEVVDGSSLLFTYSAQEEAEMARDAIQFYELSQICFVARPDPPMQYWLVEGTPPLSQDGEPFDEDCLPVDPDNVEVQQDGSDWEVVDGSSLLFTYSAQEEAEMARDAIQFYELSQICFVARPDPPMQYWLR